MAIDAAMWRFLEQSDVVLLLQLTPDGVIRACNGAVRALVGGDATGTPLARYLAAHDADALPARLRAAGTERFPVNVVDAQQDPHTYEAEFVVQDDGPWLVAEPRRADEAHLRKELLELNNQLAVATRENARTARELAAALRDLEASHWHIRKIQEVLPICMQCGRVKGETQWEDVVTYLRKHARFLSHGYCNDCGDALRAAQGLEPRNSGIRHGG